jgi:DNA-binding NarL/FixJ family response regulator
LAFWNARRLDEAEGVLERFAARASGLDHVCFAQLRGWIEVGRERYSAAIRHFDEALRAYAACGERDEWLRARILQAVSALSMETLDLPMLPQLEKQLPRDAVGEAREPVFHATQNIGWLVMLSGRPLDALAYFEQARSVAATPALRSVASLNVATYHRLRNNTSAAAEYLALARTELAGQNWLEANVDERMTLLEYALEAYHLDPHTAAATLTRYLSHTKKLQGNLSFEDDARVEAIELMARGVLEAIHRRRSSAVAALRDAGAIWARLGYRYREVLTDLLANDIDGDETWLRRAGRAAASAPKSWLRREIERRETRARTGVASLTPAERRVMLAICEGKSSKQIAAEFGRSFHTIRNQTLKVYHAMGVRSRGELIVECSRLGIVAPPQT